MLKSLVRSLWSRLSVVKPKRTASKKKTFDDILKNALTDSEYDSDEVIINVHQALNYIAEENSMSNTPSTLDNHAMENLKTSIPEDIAIKIEAACIEEFGDESPCSRKHS